MASWIYRFLEFCFCASHAWAADTLYQGGDSLNSSNTLVSKNGLFTLGFKRLGSAESNASYLGIWDNNGRSHPFWLANRDKSIADNSGVLAIDGSGNMKLIYSGGHPVEFNSSQSSTTNITAILEDSGNFVLKDENSSSQQVLWQSFDFPTDTFLPGMKLGINHRTGQNWSLVSWLSDIVPISAGAFTFQWDTNGTELVIKRRDVLYWTSGPLRSNTSFENFYLNSGKEVDFSFINVSKAEEDYFMFTVSANQYAPQGQRIFSMWQLTSDGSIVDLTTKQTHGGPVCKGNNKDGGCERWKGPACRSNRNSFELRSGYFVNTVSKVDDNSSLSSSDSMDICWKDCQCVSISTIGNNANKTGCTFWYGSFTQGLSGNNIHKFIHYIASCISLILTLNINLIQAWELWKAGTPFELVDPVLRESCSKDQVLRCIHVGLLCVEDNAVDRPIMSDVISMLTSEAQLPLPKQPAFSSARSIVEENPAETGSINDVSMSTMYAR